MESKDGINRFGPIALTQGVTRFDVVTGFYAAFVCIGMLTGPVAAMRAATTSVG